MKWPRGRPPPAQQKRRERSPAVSDPRLRTDGDNARRRGGSGGSGAGPCAPRRCGRPSQPEQLDASVGSFEQVRPLPLPSSSPLFPPGEGLRAARARILQQVFASKEIYSARRSDRTRGTSRGPPQSRALASDRSARAAQRREPALASSSRRAQGALLRGAPSSGGGGEPGRGEGHRKFHAIDRPVTALASFVPRGHEAGGVRARASPRARGARSFSIPVARPAGGAPRRGSPAPRAAIAPAD